MKERESIAGRKNPNFKTGLALEGNRHPIYTLWINMRNRCFYTKGAKYHRYGGRGITVCEDWMNIKNFHAWCIESGWQKGLQLDRIDNDGNYCPENCQWVTHSANSRKKSTTKLSMEQVKVIREKLSQGRGVYDLAKEYGVNNSAIWYIQNNFTHVADGEYTKKKKERESRKALKNGHK